MSETPNNTAFSLTEINERIDQIIEEHHSYLNNELPMLHQFVSKIAKVHGPNDHEELYELEKLYHELKNELEDLLHHEESLFPLIKTYFADASSASIPSIRGDIAVINTKQEKVNALLKQMREVTSDYTLPEHACRTYTLTFTKLGELESNVSKHIDYKSNVIFPRVLTETHE